MRTDEYLQHDATGLAALIASKQVQPAEVLAAAQARADAVQPKLNFLHWRLDEHAAKQLAGPLSGPFAGVPFLAKDIAQDIAGAPAAAGSAALRTHIAAEDNEYIRRCKAAGLVIFGKTATPEFALKGVTEPEAFGPTRNPVNPAHTPGGSSGGAAAAVGAGVVPVAGASDGGGSIRIPAAYCGLFGLRPSRGRVACGPLMADYWDGASSEHVITRSVRDSAAMLDALSGSSVGEPYRIQAPSERFAVLAQQMPRKLRIAYCTRSPIDTPVDAEIIEATKATAHLLESLGHHVEEDWPAVDGHALAKSFMTMYLGQVATDVARCKALGAEDHQFELDTRALDLLGRALPAAEYIEQTRQWNTYGRALGEFFTRYDLYLTPTTAATAPRIGALSTPAWQRAALMPMLKLNAGRALLATGQLEKLVYENLKYTPYTQLSNLTGTPSMSCPLATSRAGLPIGMQFVAAMGEEGLLLGLASQLEPHFQLGRSRGL